MNDRIASARDALMPDLILCNAKVLTVDADFSLARSVAVKDGRIVAVGPDFDLDPLAGSRTRVVDLAGRMVLPGINDCHMHLAAWGATRPPVSIDVSFPAVKSIADVRASVKDKVESLGPGVWVRGFGWDEAYLTECRDGRRRPGRADLDDVSPDNPVMLTHFSGGHLVWVNSKALELAGITHDTPDPDGGVIIRDPSTGEPTGLLNEPNATLLVARVVPRLSRREKREAIVGALGTAKTLGITSATEPGLGHSISGVDATDMEVTSIYNDLLDEGALTLRLSFLLMFSDLFEGGRMDEATLAEYLKHIGMHTGFGNNWLRLAGIKVYSDSMPLNKSSWMNEEYPGGGFGGLLVTGSNDQERYEELHKIIKYASKRRFQLGIHSTGDRAIDAVVDGIAKALSEDPWDARHYIVHGDYITQRAVELMAKHNIGVATQSLIKWTISDASDEVLGEARSATEWPFRRLLDAGVHVANSSDAPVVFPDWRMGVEAAVTREARASGKVSGPEECVSREEAIRSYTIEGAWIDHMDHVKGSIEVGKLADFCVLDGDILECAVHDIHTVPIVATLVDGKAVWDQLGLFA
jgi:predicted amidohydrolase YtcJ